MRTDRSPKASNPCSSRKERKKKAEEKGDASPCLSRSPAPLYRGFGNEEPEVRWLG